MDLKLGYNIIIDYLFISLPGMVTQNTNHKMPFESSFYDNENIVWATSQYFAGYLFERSCEY